MQAIGKELIEFLPAAGVMGGAFFCFNGTMCLCYSFGSRFKACCQLTGGVLLMAISITALVFQNQDFAGKIDTFADPANYPWH